MRTLILLLLFGVSNTIAQTNCEAYVDDGPLTRLVTPNEDRVVSGNYEAVAQRYNSVDATITSVTFWARTNPANSNGDTVNTVTVKLLYVNPSSGGINGAKITNAETTVEVDTSATHQMVTATFSPAIPVNDTNIMVVLEPTSPGTDDFFVKRSTDGDGGGLKLILLKQGGMWFNNNSLGGGYDYDLQILLNQSVTVWASFTRSVTGDTVTFTNTSSGSINSYFWDFGDGNTSVTTDPVHIYSTMDTFVVALTAYAVDTSCHHTTSGQVIIAPGTGIEILRNEMDASYDMDNAQLVVYSKERSSIVIHNLTGQIIESLQVNAGTNRFDLSDVDRGFYIVADMHGRTHKLVIPK